MTVDHFRLGVEQLGARAPKTVGDQIEQVAEFEMPEVSPLYRLAFWLMYPLDYPFQRLTGKHLCTSVYETGLIGTRPRIVESACTHCGACVEACPLPNVIDLGSLKVSPQRCQRCLLCVEACPEGAIVVKGMSGAALPTAPAAEAEGKSAKSDRTASIADRS